MFFTVPFEKVAILGVDKDLQSLTKLEFGQKAETETRYVHRDQQQFIACTTDDFYGDVTEIMIFGRKILDHNRRTYQDWEQINMNPSLSSKTEGFDNKAAFRLIQGLQVQNLVKSYDQFECRAQFGIDPLQTKTKRVFLAFYG
ncbi:hypothetical protein Ciccas_006390 [Cichlidogyrus casuarinus]|uniref:Uncharacterized protein n=1 Tax=Cichlidogyrus casuarinus TaxID=1844966 RepID=A0ABD2Q6G1_9PLAT